MVVREASSTIPLVYDAHCNSSAHVIPGGRSQMLCLEGQQVAYVAEWWQSTVKTWIDGSYRTIERHFITDFIAAIAISLNLPLREFNVNAKNVICQFLVSDRCSRNSRAKRFIMVDPR